MSHLPPTLDTLETLDKDVERSRIQFFFFFFFFHFFSFFFKSMTADGLGFTGGYNFYYDNMKPNNTPIVKKNIFFFLYFTHFFY